MHASASLCKATLRGNLEKITQPRKNPQLICNSPLAIIYYPSFSFNSVATALGSAFF